MHMAGHHNEGENLIIDSHGANVIDPVWTLLDQAYQIHGARPTLLERDFNIPPLDELVREIQRIHTTQIRHARQDDDAAAS
jgi:uncharacterized protein (UPF0276 family)